MKILNQLPGHNKLKEYTLDHNDLDIFTSNRVAVSEDIAILLCEYLEKTNEVVLIIEKMFNGSWKGRHFMLNGVNYAPNANDLNLVKLENYLKREL
jgi:hypothetical protein